MALGKTLVRLTSTLVIAIAMSSSVREAIAQCSRTVWFSGACTTCGCIDDQGAGLFCEPAESCWTACDTRVGCVFT